jgi:chromosome segregation ATPase
MKMVEIAYNKEVKELEKLNAKLERAKKAYEKKLETAKKYGVENWDNNDYYKWLETVETTKNGFIVNKSDIKINSAWFDMVCAEDEVKDLEKSIARAEKRLENAEIKLDEYHKEVQKITDLKEREKLMQAEFEKEQKQWAKDGITLEARYYGTTPNGKRFYIERNNSETFRSMHCFTLTIDGETIFTSGEFWRAYIEIKRR